MSDFSRFVTALRCTRDCPEIWEFLKKSDTERIDRLDWYPRRGHVHLAAYVQYVGAVERLQGWKSHQGSELLVEISKARLAVHPNGDGQEELRALTRQLIALLDKFADPQPFRGIRRFVRGIRLVKQALCMTPDDEAHVIGDPVGLARILTDHEVALERLFPDLVEEENWELGLASTIKVELQRGHPSEIERPGWRRAAGAKILYCVYADRDPAKPGLGEPPGGDAATQIYVHARSIWDACINAEIREPTTKPADHVRILERALVPVT